MAKVDKWADADERERAAVLAALPLSRRIAYRVTQALFCGGVLTILAAVSGSWGAVQNLFRAIWE